MKIFIAMIFISSMALGSDCPERKKIHCSLEWNSGKEKLQVFEEECQFPTDEKEACMVMKTCGEASPGDTGASVFRKSTSPESYCLSGKDTEVFSPSDDSSPTVWIVCKGIKNPAALKLISPDKKNMKICPFPFSKGNK